MSGLGPELQRLFDDGAACGQDERRTPAECPVDAAEEPGKHAAWMNGFMVGRIDAGLPPF